MIERVPADHIAGNGLGGSCRRGLDAKTELDSDGNARYGIAVASLLIGPF
ncbi:hypothetical protein [Chitinasiproducens palmae]|nr:hypothetical protein [Chitinasiproducens palmae]